MTESSLVARMICENLERGWRRRDRCKDITAVVRGVRTRNEEDRLRHLYFVVFVWAV